VSLRIAVVVPCYNEAARLDPHELIRLADAIAGDVIVVDDGSTDGTADLIDRAVQDPRVSVLRLPRNRGKAEAVRHGLQAAVEREYDITGYCDADFATPVEEVARIVCACAGGSAVVLGSRVGLMGHGIVRSPVRHYTGRVFATCSSLVLGFQVYDTQCGAKAFRVDNALRAAIAAPFVSRWAFDVELLGRLAHARGGVDDFLELPLTRWHDAAGSKLTWRASARAAADLWRIRAELRRANPGTPRTARR